MKGAQESRQGRRQLKKTEKKKKKKKKNHLYMFFSFSTVFVAIFMNCFILFSNVSGNVFANHALFLPYRICK